jgi:ABC-type nitrate/sulfonate/bicarbonate transport system substrate-binding protein
MKKNIYRFAALLLIPVFLVLASGCSDKPATTGQDTGEKELRVVKTWSRKDCTLAPFLIADKKGFFAEQGLKIEYVGDIDASARIPAIISGSIDVGNIHPNGLAIAIANGAKLKGVVRSIVDPPAEITDIHLQHMWWVSDKNGPIKTISDVAKQPGKVKFGVQTRNSCIEYLTDKIRAKENIPADKIEWITMPDIQQVQALKQGLIAVATPHPPFYKAIEDTGIGNILYTSRQAAGGENAGTYLFYFSDKFIAEHPDIVKDFVIAIKNAERWINDNKEETNRLTEADIGVPVTANHYYAPDGRIPDKDIQEWIDGTVAGGGLKEGQVTVNDVITHEFDSFGVAKS